MPLDPRPQGSRDGPPHPTAQAAKTRAGLILSLSPVAMLAPKKSQSQRTGESRQKLERGVEQLRPWAQKHPDEKLCRTDIPSRIRSRLEGTDIRTAHPSVMLHLITAVLFETALRYEIGERVCLEDAWKKLMQLVARLKPRIANQLNDCRYRDAFIWQIAGHIETWSYLLDPIDKVLIMERTRGARKGQREEWAKLKDGEVIKPPKAWLRPVWPKFLCLGEKWRGRPVFNYTVANMSLEWPCKELEPALKLTLWEPPVRNKPKAR